MYIHIPKPQTDKPRAGEMVQQFRALVALPEDLGFSGSTWCLTTVSNSSLKGSNTLLWPLRTLHTYGAQTFTQTKHSNNL